MSDFITLLGYMVICVSALLVCALCIVGLCKLANWVVWHCLESYGGIKTFKDYRYWYHNIREIDEVNHD